MHVYVYAVVLRNINSMCGHEFPNRVRMTVFKSRL